MEIKSMFVMAEKLDELEAKNAELEKNLADVESQRNSCIVVYEEQKYRLIEKLEIAVKALNYFANRSYFDDAVALKALAAIKGIK